MSWGGEYFGSEFLSRSKSNVSSRTPLLVSFTLVAQVRLDHSQVQPMIQTKKLIIMYFKDLQTMIAPKLELSYVNGKFDDKIISLVKFLFRKNDLSRPLKDLNEGIPNL